MRDYLLGPASEIPEGGRKLVQCGHAEIGVFRHRGELFAWHNSCPHRQGPVCQGRIYKRVVEPVDANGEVRMLQYDEERSHLVCPWHGYEFDLTTGRTVALEGLHLRKAELRIEEGDLYVRV